MSYRKGEDTPAKRRRRLPFKAVVEEREEPFLAVDLHQLEAECRRITNGAEFLYSMERNGDRYEHVVQCLSSNAIYFVANFAPWTSQPAARIDDRARVLVVYYSRSGTTRHIVHALAPMLGVADVR